MAAGIRADTARSVESPVNGTENKSFSCSLQLIPPVNEGDFDLNQFPVCVDSIRPSSTPKAGRRLSKKTLAICPAPVARLEEALQAVSISCVLTNNCCTACRLALSLWIGTCRQNHPVDAGLKGSTGRFFEESWPQKMPRKFGQVFTPMVFQASTAEFE